MSEHPHLRKGDRVRVVDAKRREDLRWDGRMGRVGVLRRTGELIVNITDRGDRSRIGTLLPLEGPEAVIVELVATPQESGR